MKVFIPLIKDFILIALKLLVPPHDDSSNKKEFIPKLIFFTFQFFSQFLKSKTKKIYNVINS